MISTRDWVSALPKMLQNQEPESLHLDYKARDALLPPSRRRVGIDTEKRAADISKDVSAFLNSDGGALVYGVREERRLAGARGDPEPQFDSSKDGFAPGEVTKEQIEDIITSNIRSRPGPDLFTVVEVPMSNRNVYVIDIAKSMVGAFQANDKKYYKRFNYKSEPMEHYEIEDVRRRAIGPQLELVAGLTSTWDTEAEIPAYTPGSKASISLHFGIRNIGLGTAETALVEIGLPPEVRVAGAPPTLLGAATRTTTWTTPRGVTTDEVNWYEFRWTPQTMDRLYLPLFAMQDPRHAFNIDLASTPDKDGRIAIVCWQLQAPNMALRKGIIAVDHSGNRIARVTPLDWPLDIEPVA